MSIVVNITEDGVDRMYFRISGYEGSMFVERPDKASIHASDISEVQSIEDQVIAALDAIRREDDKWTTLQEQPSGVSYPKLSDLDS